MGGGGGQRRFFLSKPRMRCNKKSSHLSNAVSEVFRALFVIPNAWMRILFQADHVVTSRMERERLEEGATESKRERERAIGEKKEVPLSGSMNETTATTEEENRERRRAQNLPLAISSCLLLVF